MILKAIKTSQQFVKEDASAHWYGVQPDGTIVSRHDADLRVARKERLYPSPTTIEKDIRANPSLSRWIKNEVAKAFVNNPRLPEENDDVYAARVLQVADSRRDNAATRGTAIHKAIENEGTDDPVILPFYEAYRPWHEENIETTVGSEVKMADDSIGVAGTTDRVVMHKKHGLLVLDYKTQQVKDGKASFWESFPRQLSFYSGAYYRKHGVLPGIMSVVIDSQNPSRPYEKLYTKEQQAHAYREFLCNVWLWCASKGKDGYWPAGNWLPNFGAKWIDALP